MTETELANALKTGNAEVIQPPAPDNRADLASQVEQLQMQLRDYVPLLEKLRNGGGATKNFVTEVVEVKLDDIATVLKTNEINTTGVMKIYIYINGLSASGIINIGFNGDTGANYSYRLSSNSGAFSNTTGANKIDLAVTSNNNPIWCELSILNDANIAKILVGKLYQSSSGGAGNPVDITGTWDNTADKIKSITVTVDGSITLEAGSRLVVWGSTN